MQSIAADEGPVLIRALANIAETFRVVARLSPRGMIDEADGLAMIATGIPYPLFNPAFVTRPLADPTTLAARLRGFYARAGVAGLLLAAGDDGRNAEPLARAAGLLPGDPIPGMLLCPIPAPPPTPPGLAIRVVRDPETLRVYNDTVARGYGMPRAMLALFDDPATLTIPDLTFYLGFLGGVPVATALRASSHRIAGVYNVATLPAYRRRGLGAALSWRAAADGRAEGCVASFLQSSEMGLPVYERMGYRRVVDYRTWTIADPPPTPGA